MDKTTLRQALTFIGAKLDTIAALLSGKEKIDISVGDVIAKLDMSETNALLRELIAKEKEDIEVRIDIV